MSGEGFERSDGQAEAFNRYGLLQGRVVDAGGGGVLVAANIGQMHLEQKGAGRQVVGQVLPQQAGGTSARDRLLSMRWARLGLLLARWLRGWKSSFFSQEGARRHRVTASAPRRRARLKAVAFLLMTLPPLAACGGDARSNDVSSGGRIFMSGEHKVLGDEIESYSHSDPNLIRQPLTRSQVTKIVWSPNGTRLASLASNSDEMILWDAATSRVVKKISLGRPLQILDQPMAFTSDGKTIVMFRFPDAPQHTYSLIDGVTGENMRQIAAPIIDGSATNLQFAAAARENKIALMFSSVGTQTVLLYDASTWKPTETVFTMSGLRVPQYEHDMALSPDGRKVAMLKTLRREIPLKNDPARTMSDSFYKLDLWSIEERRLTSSVEINRQDWSSSWPSMIRFSPDGRFIAVGIDNEDHRPVRVLDAATGAEVHAYESPRGEKGWPVWGSIHGLDWSPDGRLITFCGEDKSVYVLDAHSTSVLDKVAAPGACWAAAFSPDGSRIAYGADHTVIIRKILSRS